MVEALVDQPLSGHDERRQASIDAICSVLTSPGAGEFTVTEICQAAGVARRTYYECHSDPKFRQCLRAWYAQVFGGETEMIRRVLRSSEIPGTRGFADRQLAIKMMGMMPVDERQVSIDLAVKHGTIPDAQMLWLYHKLNAPRSMWIPSIAQAVEQGRLSPEPCPSLLGPPAEIDPLPES